jgi:hypothetical protein
MDRCNWKGCRNESDLRWLKKELCQKHWQQVCDIDGTERGVKVIYEKLRVRRPIRGEKDDQTRERTETDAG